LSHAFDFEWLNKSLLHGAFRRIDSFFPNSELAAKGEAEGAERALLAPYADRLPPGTLDGTAMPPVTDGDGGASLRENLKKAADLLKQAGWIVRDNERVHEKSGQKLDFEILLNDANDEKVALAFARNLKKLGVAVQVRTVDSAQFTGRLDKFDYDMVLHQWINSLSPGNEQVNYWGSAAADRQGSRNYAGVRDPVVDALADGIARAPDREALVTRVRALDRVLGWGYYTIPLYYLGRDLVARSPGIGHPDKTPLYGMVLETWWRKPASNNPELVKP
jgi:microcin C transport system substrate-binding protein